MSSKIELEKICRYCGRTFIARKTVTQYCSHPCSQRAYKDRKRSEKLGKIAEIIPAPKPTDQKAPIHYGRDFLSVQETAELMGLSRATVHRYCVHGKIRCVKINRKIFIRRQDIDALFEEAAPYEVTPRTPPATDRILHFTGNNGQVQLLLGFNLQNSPGQANSQDGLSGQNGLQQKAYRPPFCA